jgi:hypothetical protein
MHATSVQINLQSESKIICENFHLLWIFRYIIPLNVSFVWRFTLSVFYCYYGQIIWIYVSICSFNLFTYWKRKSVMLRLENFIGWWLWLIYCLAWFWSKDFTEEYLAFIQIVPCCARLWLILYPSVFLKQFVFDFKKLLGA